VLTKQLPEFQSSLTVYYCSPRAFLKELTPLLTDGDMVKFSEMIKEASGYFLASEDGQLIIWICSDAKTVEEVLGILVHESHHLSTHINEHYDLASEEYCAYLEGEVVSTVFKKLKNRLT